MTPLVQNKTCASVPSHELWDDDVMRLGKAAGWARVAAVAAYVYAGLGALQLFRSILQVPVSAGWRTGSLLVFAARLASFIAGAALFWRYARNVLLFITSGEPTLAQAFRSLRRFLQLWTAFVAFDTAWTVFGLFGRR